MSRNILTYFHETPAELRLLDVTMPVSIARPLENGITLDEVRKLMLKFDYNHIYHATITSKEHDYLNNKAHYTYLESLLNKYCANFHYILFPAYQDRMVLHFHGYFIFNKTGQNGLSSSKMLQRILNDNYGWTKIKHMRSQCYTKVYNSQLQLINSSNYDFSEDNYGGCKEYCPMTNIPLDFFS